MTPYPFRPLVAGDKLAIAAPGQPRTTGGVVVCPGSQGAGRLAGDGPLRQRHESTDSPLPAAPDEASHAGQGGLASRAAHPGLAARRVAPGRAQRGGDAVRLPALMAACLRGCRERP